VIKVNVNEMCLEAVFIKTGKSLRRSDGLRETVRHRKKGSVSDLGSCPWNNEVKAAGGTRRMSCRVATGRCNGFSQVHHCLSLLLN